MAPSLRDNFIYENDDESDSVEEEDLALHLTLEIRELRMSIQQGSTNSMIQLGDLYFLLAKKKVPQNSTRSKKRKNFLSKKYYELAIYWYRKASSMNHPLGSYYAAMMLHFGLGVDRNVLRAGRLYRLALKQRKGAFDAKSSYGGGSIFNFLIASPGNSIKDLTYTDSQVFWSLVELLNWLVTHDSEFIRSGGRDRGGGATSENYNYGDSSSSASPDDKWAILGYFHFPINEIVKTLMILL